MDRWIGKVAVVTGASAGIGAAIAETLVRQGIIVAGFARRKEKVDELANKLKEAKGSLYGVKVDLANEKEIIDGFEWVKKTLGPIHILVNNAGDITNDRLIEGDAQRWKQVFEINVIALSIATREAVKDMRANNVDGHIIHISSIIDHWVISMPKINVYPATKAAVGALSETLRHEFLQNNLKIKITTVSPGIVKTETVEAEGFPDYIPMLSPKDVANGVSYILSTPPHVQIQQLTIAPFDVRDEDIPKE